MGRGNVQNLKDMSTRTKEEVRRIASLGGKNSGKSRKKAKNLKECAKYILSLNLVDEQAKTKIKEMGIKDKDASYAMLMTIAMVQSAIKGDVSAYRSLCEQEKQLNNSNQDDKLDPISISIQNSFTKSE